MDSYQRLKKNKSFIVAGESSRKKVIALCLTSAFSFACQNSATKPNVPSAQEKEVAPANLEQQINSSKNSEMGTLLTQIGSNSDLFLSEDSKKLFYASSARKSHNTKQIYMLDFNSMKERRLTFNDGDNSSPIFIEGLNLLAYSSNTDSLKEHPIAFYPNKSKIESDIYISEISGSSINRLTQQDGIESDLQNISGKKAQFLFQSIGTNRKTISQMNALNKGTTTLFSLPITARSVRLSPDQKTWLWIEQQNSKELLQLNPNPAQNKTSKTINIPFDKIVDFNWISSKQIILAGTPKESLNADSEKLKKFLIAVIDIEKNCLQKVIKSDASMSSPIYDPQKKSVIYSSDASGSSQIYLKQISLNETSCQNF